MGTTIVVLPGDGVGPEVMAQGLRVLRTVGEGLGIDFEVVEFPCGGKYYLDHGKEWPDDAFITCRDDSDAILLGAVGWPGAWMPDGRLAGSSVVLGLRFNLDLYANIRPIKLYPNVRHQVSERFAQVWEPRDVDLVIVRENTEGIYADTHGQLNRGGKVEVATDVRIITRKGAERIIRHAFAICAARGGAPKDKIHRVTCVDKSNVLSGCRLFRSVYDEVASEHPDVAKDYAYIDAFQQWLVRSPELYDVVVTTNMFGDIATDLGAVLQGGMGMAASANVGERHGMFEPIHGSAPKHAGQDRVNPIAMVLSVQAMLAWLGERRKDATLRRAAVAVEGAVMDVLADGSRLTYDLGGTATTTAVGDALLVNLRRRLGKR